MSRMFKLWKGGRIATVNPFNGCEFGCYGGNCWAKKQAIMKQNHPNPKVRRGYENGFEPSLCPYRMDDFSKKADVVWIGDMGDTAFVPTEYIERIIAEAIEPNPEILFFLETKKPDTYSRFVDVLPENVLLSTTIETNRPYELSSAPDPLKRFVDFRNVDWERKHVSVEPIVKFDYDVLIDWVKGIGPQIVSVGYDNYNCGLPEPPRGLTERLIGELEEFTEVERKTIREKNEEESLGREL